MGVRTERTGTGNDCRVAGLFLWGGWKHSGTRQWWLWPCTVKTLSCTLSNTVLNTKNTNFIFMYTSTLITNNNSFHYNRRKESTMHIWKGTMKCSGHSDSPQPVPSIDIVTLPSVSLRLHPERQRVYRWSEWWVAACWDGSHSQAALSSPSCKSRAYKNLHLSPW